MTTLQLIKELEEQADEGERKGIQLRTRTAKDYNEVQQPMPTNGNLFFSIF